MFSVGFHFYPSLLSKSKILKLLWILRFSRKGIRQIDNLFIHIDRLASHKHIYTAELWIFCLNNSISMCIYMAFYRWILPFALLGQAILHRLCQFIEIYFIVIIFYNASVALLWIFILACVYILLYIILSLLLPCIILYNDSPIAKMLLDSIMCFPFLFPPYFSSLYSLIMIYFYHYYYYYLNNVTLLFMSILACIYTVYPVLLSSFDVSIPLTFVWNPSAVIHTEWVVHSLFLDICWHYRFSALSLPPHPCPSQLVYPYIVPSLIS